jgi:hypothetical protein
MAAAATFAVAPAGATACGHAASNTAPGGASDSGALDSTSSDARLTPDAPSVDGSSSGAVDSSAAGDAEGSDAGADADAGPAPSQNPCLPFVMPPASALFASPRRVFAHYFYPFPLSIDDQPSATDYYETQYLEPGGENGKWTAQGGYLRQRPLSVDAGPASTWTTDDVEKEVRMAIAAGITGFTVDVLSTTAAQAGGQVQTLLTAASATDARFKIVAMPDLAALGADASAVESILAAVASAPASYHLPDGRLVASAFEAEVGSVAFWQGVLSDLAASGIQVAFVPTFLDASHAPAFAPITYGYGNWGTMTPAGESGQQAGPGEAHDAGQLYMMPVGSQQYRPKDFLFWEAGNSLAFRSGWTSATSGGSDWVQIVTWSDFSESGEIEPYTDRSLAGDIGTGFYSLNAYYASWFLTGQAPAITEDVLYYFYRREPAGAAAPEQSKPTTVAAGGGQAQDQIELLGFLTAPGTLTVTIGGQSFTKSAAAGITSFTVPLQPGTPTFALQRGGAQVLSFTGGVPIVGDGGLDSGTLDLTYWSGSASPSGSCVLRVP